jgi:hypothetical protein
MNADDMLVQHFFGFGNGYYHDLFHSKPIVSVNAELDGACVLS